MNPHRTTGLLFALLLGATTVPAAQAATASTTAAATRTADADDLRADAAPQFGITYTVRTAERFDFDAVSTSTASFSQRSDDPSTRRSAQNHTRWHNSKKHQHGYFLHGKFWRFFHERR